LNRVARFLGFTPGSSALSPCSVPELPTWFWGAEDERSIPHSTDLCIYFGKRGEGNTKQCEMSSETTASRGRNGPSCSFNISHPKFTLWLHLHYFSRAIPPPRVGLTDGWNKPAASSSAHRGGWDDPSQPQRAENHRKTQKLDKSHGWTRQNKRNVPRG